MVTRRAKMERMAPIAPPTLSDGAVTLRPPADADGPALVRACQDPEIPRWTRVPRPYTPEDARQFVAIAATEAAAGLGVALVIADEREALIGTIGLMELDAASGRAEIGDWLAREARGRGAATRAVPLLCAWAARELGVRRGEILTHRDHAPAARVAERAGVAPAGETPPGPRLPPGRRDGYVVHVRRAPEP